MKRSSSSTITGWILVGIGTLLVLENFDLLGSLRDTVLSLVFAAGGIAFLAVFASRHEAWWAALPGFTLLGLAAVLGFQIVTPDAPSRWSGPLFLGALSLGFWAIFIVTRAQWWSIIPGGILATLAVVAGVAPGTNGRVAGSIFWLGFGLTFVLVYLVHGPRRSAAWALIAAGVCLVLALATMGAMMGWIDIAWPLALIGAGLILVARTLWPHARPATVAGEPARTTAPQALEEGHADQTVSQPH
jgi:hypothetical protein